VRSIVSVRLKLVEGDITAQRADAIVNAANTRMRGGGGVDGAIHRAGGPAILEDCTRRFPDGLPTGNAGWTTAGDLPASWVIHVVGPNWNAGQRDEGLLASCYREALRVADELGARSVAFPAVSTGVYGWPLDDAASIAVETVATTSTSVEDVVFVLFGSDAYSAFAAARKQVEIES
jgi:O-acetyl-ADP-ribose deacetylase